ncbi:MAG: three-Cys-motif partner protein TcmP [Candidatus Paceibacterota bacterium]
MKKIKEKIWSNVPYKTWEYEKQTKMKHNVFNYYFPIWLKILSSRPSIKELTYVDGFGGIGAYHSKEDIKGGIYLSENFGSPIFSISAVDKIEKEKNTKVNVVIIDKLKENLENIKKILIHNKLSIKNCLSIEGDFDVEVNKYLDSIDGKIMPTLYFIDPFGISGIKLKTLRRMMKNQYTEILLNFMYNSLQRWIDHPNPKVNKIYDEYFDGDQWRSCKGKHLKEKEEKLVSIFRSKCKDFSGFVYPFKIKFPKKNQTYYYLFHLSDSSLACSLMKDSFAKFNNGKSEYEGEIIQSSLLVPLEKKEKKEKFQEKLKNIYKGRKTKYHQIIDNFIDETDLLQSEIKIILSKMEKEKLIKVDPGDHRKRTKGFKNFDFINFV